MTSWLWLVLAAAAGAALSASACRWWFGRSMALMHERLEQSELSRQAAHDRNQQTRQQIDQLTRMIQDLQKRQKATLDATHRRARLGQQVPGEAADPSAAAAHGFADTEPLA